MSDRIKFNIVRCQWSRYDCDLCGGLANFNKGYVLAQSDSGLIACEECIQSDELLWRFRRNWKMVSRG
jgi:hypothetical protein